MPSASSHAVVAEGLTKRYREVTALDGLDLAVAAGTVLALLGPNGAGKTTTVRILCTLLAADAGRATVAGHDVARHPQRVRSVIGLAGQYAAVDEDLTGRENLELVGRLHHLGGAAAGRRATELLAQFDLTGAADRAAQTYSGGMRRRLDLAASLVARPQVLFLDEPTAGLDPRSRMALWDVIRSLHAEGTTVLLTTQYLEEADRLADRVVVIDEGRAIAEGTPDELKRKVGGDVIEVTLADRRRSRRAAALLRPLASGEVVADTAGGRLAVPVPGGPSALVEVVRALDGARIRIADVTLRRPTLDDVFLALTGEVARRDAEPEQAMATVASERPGR